MKKIAFACVLLMSTLADAQPLVAVIETERGVMKADLNDGPLPPPWQIS